MVKVLFITTIPITLEAFFLRFARHFRARGWRVDAMSNGVSTSLECIEAFDQVWDIDWARSPFTPSNLFHSPQKVREIVQREQYDLVHTHTPVASFVTRLALRHVRKVKSCPVTA